MRTSLKPGLFLEKAHLLVGLLCLLAILIQPTEVRAHASFLGSTPTDGSRLEVSPTEIELEFSEPVGLVEGGTSLHRQDGEPIALTPIVNGSTVTVPLESPLENGAYILQWRVISADSHPISGTIRFSVGNDAQIGDFQIHDNLPAWVEWGTALAKTLGYSGLLLSLGMLVVGWLLVRPDMDLVASLVVISSWVGAAGLLLEFPFAAITRQGSVPGDLGEMWTTLRLLDSGTAWSLALGISLLIAVAITSRSGLRDRDLFLMVAIMNATAVFSLVLTGHTRSKTPLWLMFTSDAVHLAAAAIWLGGLAILVPGLTGRWRGSAFKNLNDAANVVAGFSRIAAVVAIALILSGVAMGITILRSWEALFNTEYGTTLMIKVGLVTLTLVLAAVNRFVLLPGRERSLGWLRRVVSLELVLVVLVVGVTSVLVQQNPAVQTQSAPTNLEVFNDTIALDDSHTIHLQVTQRDDEELDVSATILDEDGIQVVSESDLEMSWYLQSQDLGPLEYSIPTDADGGFSGTVSLPMAGTWDAEIRANVDRFTDSRTTISLEIP